MDVGVKSAEISHSPDGVCRRFKARHTVVVNCQGLECDRKPNPAIMSLLGDYAAHEYILVLNRRTTQAPPTC